MKPRRLVIKSILDLIQSSLKNSHCHCDVEIQTVGLRANFQDGMVIVARPNADQSTIKFIATCFHAVSPENVNDFCCFIARANAHLVVGHFALELETLELRYYFDMPVDCITDVESAQVATTNTIACVINSFQSIRQFFDIDVDQLNNAAVIDILSQVQTAPGRAVENDQFSQIQTILDIVSIKTHSVVVPNRRNRSFRITDGESALDVRVNPELGNVFVRSILKLSPCQAHRTVVTAVARANSRLKIGHIKMDRKRNQLVVSGNIRLNQQVPKDELITLVQEHFIAAHRMKPYIQYGKASVQ